MTGPDRASLLGRVAADREDEVDHRRIAAFLGLPLEQMSRDQIVAAARDIHEEA
jgi:hypothetical protein